jgi:hypothetical protein
MPSCSDPRRWPGWEAFRFAGLERFSLWARGRAYIGLDACATPNLRDAVHVCARADDCRLGKEEISLLC